jgi:hypothetical protein
VDFSQILTQLQSGNVPVWLVAVLAIVAYLFRGQLSRLPAPAPPATPTPAVPAAPVAPVTPNEHPAIKQLLQLLITTAPPIIKGAEKEAKENTITVEPPK